MPRDFIDDLVEQLDLHRLKGWELDRISDAVTRERSRRMQLAHDARTNKPAAHVAEQERKLRLRRK